MTSKTTWISVEGFIILIWACVFYLAFKSEITENELFVCYCNMELLGLIFAKNRAVPVGHSYVFSNPCVNDRRF